MSDDLIKDENLDVPENAEPKDEAELRKIVVVDDLNFHLVSVTERLKKHYEIFPVLSADILFELLDNFIPDLILLDIGMPEVDGFETLDRLKNEPKFTGIPVVFLTGKADRKNIQKAVDRGAVDYITKPFKDTDLIDCIEGQLAPEKQEINKAIILAVDDSPSILLEIDSALSDMFRVYTLPEPERLNDLLNIVTPDLFLLDYKMPKITGFELVPIIRDNPMHYETPILFLTSEGTIDHISAAYTLGASDFIVKPFDENNLREKIESQLRGYLIRRRMRELEKHFS